jgi:hypothetical protein
MGATYTRQSSYTDGDVITAAHTNDEFNQLLAAFQASSGHTHDGTANEGGPITKLLGNTLTFGAGTAGTDITITFDGETSDGVLKWMEDEDYFEFSDDILIASTEKLQFRDTAIYINSSTDGQLDLVADTEIQIAATTIDINGNVDISGTLTIGSAGISETELEILDGATVTTTELNIIDGDTTASSTTLADADRVVVNDAGTMKQVALTDFETYFESALDTLSNVTTVGALNSGSITSGFGAIDNGSSAITTTGTITYGSLSDGSITVTAFVDEDDMSSNSATLVPTQQSVKAYVDAQITAEDLDFQADSGGALSIDLDSETLTFTGGTGIDTSGSGNAVTFAIDSTVTTLAGSQTLTNKTLTSAVLNGTISGTSIKDEDDMTSNSASHLATQQSIKAYVDAQITAEDLDFQADSGGALSIDLDSETLTFTGGTGIDTSGSGNAVTFAIDSTVATLSGTQTLTNKTLTSPKINEDVALTSTATELNLLDGVSGLVQADFTKLAAVDATATELNIMDGDTSASSTTLVDADRVVTNDNGTMKQVALSDVKTYLTSAGFSTEDPTALAIALG